MADHIATRKSTFTSASTSRMTRTHSPIVNRSQERVGVYSKGVTYGAMSKQTQAEPCVLYIRVSTTRQANQGVSLKAQIARGKLHAQYQNFLLPNTHIFIDRVSQLLLAAGCYHKPIGELYHSDQPLTIEVIR